MSVSVQYHRRVTESLSARVILHPSWLFWCRARPPPLFVGLSVPAQPCLLFPLGGHFKRLVFVSQRLVRLLGQVCALSVQNELVWEVLGGPRGLFVQRVPAESLGPGPALHRWGLLIGGVDLLQQLVEPHATPELLQGAALVVHQLGVAHRPPPESTRSKDRGICKQIVQKMGQWCRHFP